MARRLYAFMPAAGGTIDALYDVAADRDVPAEDVSERDEVTVLVPGPDVAVFRVPVPARTDKEARQAAPYVIEDEIAEAVDEVHIALGPKPGDPSEARMLQVVSNARMSDWMACLEVSGLGHARLVCEQSIIPDGELVEFEGRVLGHLDGQLIAFDMDLPSDLAGAVLPETKRAQIMRKTRANLAQYADGFPGIIDLRQGVYKAASPLDMSALKTWRTSAALVAAACAIWVAVGLVETNALSQSRDAMRRDMLDIYRTAFPDAPQNVDPIRALSQRSRAGRNALEGMDFLDTSAALYRALEDVEGARFRSLRFDPERGGFSASVIYRNYGDDAKLKTALETAGYRTRIGDARQTSDGVSGDVVVEGAS